MAFYTDEDNKKRLSLTDLINQINAENGTDDEPIEELTDFDKKREAYIQEEKEKARILREQEAYEAMKRERETTPEPEPEKPKKEPIIRKAIGGAFAKMGEALYKKDDTEYIEPEDDFTRITSEHNLKNMTKDLGEADAVPLQEEQTIVLKSEQASIETPIEEFIETPAKVSENKPTEEFVSSKNELEITQESDSSDGIITAEIFLKQNQKLPEEQALSETKASKKKKLFGRIFEKKTKQNAEQESESSDIKIVKYVPPVEKNTFSYAKTEQPSKKTVNKKTQYERLKIKYEDSFAENHIFPDSEVTKANLMRINDVYVQFPASVIGLVIVMQSMTQLVIYDKKRISEFIKIFEDANYDIDYEWIFLLTNTSVQWYGSDDCPFDIMTIIENLRLEFMKGQTPSVTEDAIRRTKDIALFPNIYVKTANSK